ncbi:hypothetical protein [Actinomadura macrotermitis]|uniref:Uncharacterized protein n=1 Tax=Actinomadura macrotermitis TaxID=2585200 RepID=A0A7K0BQH9_9ACTN|nr:hypothetical protein [Actinomadura macrotermitis]MQY03286.1 hypothetical protein [Actinomadura macrotermitis]
MEKLFDGVVHVSYGQIYVQSADDFEMDLHEDLAGQQNGLCGAATPGRLFLITSTHTGSIAFTVELHDGPPPLDPSWEDVVEASFAPTNDDVALVQWAGEDAWELDLEATDYRVRYCAHGMDEAHGADIRFDGRPQPDRYLLQFWPAPSAPDQVLKQTSEAAAYWHRVARELPPPPTPEDRAAAAEQARLEEERAQRLRAEEAEVADWGGRLPSERLRRIPGNVYGLVELDHGLAEALAAAGSDLQRRVACWAARRACDEAGLARIDWIAAALEAADAGRSLPAPFDDEERAWDRLFADERVPSTGVTLPETTIDDFSQQAAALPAVWAAVEADPLHGAVDALFAAAAAFGADGYRRLFSEARAAFSL